MTEKNTPREINYQRHTARYRARRRAADILFEAETRDIDPVTIVEDRVALARDADNGVAPVADYTREIVAGTAAELDSVDDAIERYLAENWELHRLPAVDRAILRVGTWELLFNPEVPAATAIVEAVELASEYSTDKAAPYIHAVLDDIAQSRSGNSPMQAVEFEEFGEPEEFEELGELGDLGELGELEGDLGEDSAGEPAEETAGEPAEKPAEEPVGTSLEEPMEDATEDSTEESTAQQATAEQATEEPAGDVSPPESH